MQPKEEPVDEFDHLQRADQLPAAALSEIGFDVKEEEEEMEEAEDNTVNDPDLDPQSMVNCTGQKEPKEEPIDDTQSHPEDNQGPYLQEPNRDQHIDSSNEEQDSPSNLIEGRKSSRRTARPVRYADSNEEEEKEEPAVKRTKLNASKKKDSSGDSDSGVLLFRLEHASKLRLQGQSSAAIEVGGRKWKANVHRVPSSTTPGADEVHVYLSTARNRSPLWSMNVRAEYTIFNADASRNVKETHEQLFGEIDYWGCIFDDVTWQQLLDDAQGFVQDDVVRFEIRFTILNRTGVRPAPSIDFSDPHVRRHDAALTIGGEKIFVNKGILAEHSPIFEDMFYGDNKEYIKSGFVLEDVVKEEFVEMLRVIYPTRQAVTDENVEYLLKLAEKFKISLLLDLTESHLKKSRALELSTKLMISDKYKLCELQDHCLHNLKAKDVQSVKALFDDLSEELKVALRRMFLELE